MENNLRLRISFLSFLQWLAPGVAMWAVAFVGSLFQRGARAEYIRFIGLDILLVLAAIGVVRAIWIFVTSRQNR